MGALALDKKYLDLSCEKYLCLPGASVAWGAAVVEVCGDDLPLPTAPAAVGRGHRARAGLAVPEQEEDHS